MPNAVDFLNEPETAPNAIDFLNEKPDAVAFLNEPDDAAKDANPKAHSFTPSQSDIDIVARASREGKPVIMVNGKPTVGDAVKNEPLSTGDRLVQGAESSLGTTALRAGAGALRLAGESGIADELSADANAWKQKQGTDTASKIGSGIGGAAGLIASGGLPGALTNIGLQSQAEKLSFGAALKAVPELAAYWLLGMGAGKAIGPLVAQASPAVKALASGAAATTANIAASAAIRKVNGESAVPDAESLAQDALFGFGAHGMAEGRKAVLDEAAVKSMLKHAPDDALSMASEDPDFRKSAPYDPKLLDEEISRRKEQGQENSQTGDQVAQPVPTEVKDQVENNLRESNAPLTAEQVSNESKSNTNRDEQSQQGDSTTGSGLQPRPEDNAAGVRPSAPGAEGIGAADGETPTAQPAAPREADQPVVGEPGYTGGPGAMSPVEAAEMAARQKTTSIKNEVVDQARVDAEIPEREKPLRRAFGKVWDEAKAVIDTNPNKGRELVDELQKKSRPLTDTEDAILSHEQLERQDAYNNAVERVNNATGEAEMAEAKSALESARSDLHEIYDAGQKSGTANARGLAARRMMIRDDYSLARMETRMRAEQGGTPLSQSQLDQVKVAHERIAELEKKLADAESKQRDDLAKQYFDKLLDETKKDLKKSVKTGEKITDFFSRQAEAARERIRGRGSRLNAGLDPVDLFDHAIIGADYLARGVTKFAEWSAEMVKDFGEKVSPYLEQIFETSQKYHDTNSTLAEKLQPKDETPQGIAKTITKENGLDHQTVYELARAHVRAGVEGFENVMQAVTKDLKEKLPDVTERQVRDAFSEYGKTKFPSKEADRMKLAEYRRLGQLASAIEDAQKKISPQKTGLQRDKPTQAVREKMAELRKAMDEAGIETKSPAEQLASRNQARATALRNQIEDLDKQLKTGEKPAQGKPVADSPEVESLRSQRDAMKAQLKEIEDAANPPKSPEQKQLESLRSRADELRKKIAAGDTSAKTGKPTVDTKEISDARTELKSLNDQLREMRKKATPGATPEEIQAESAQRGVDAAAAAIDRWDQILKGELKPESKSPTEAKSGLEEELRSQIDSMKQAYREIQKAERPASDVEAARQKAQIKSLEKSIAEYERRVNGMDFSPRPQRQGVDTKAVSEAKAARDAAKKAYEDLQKAQQPVKSPEEIKLEAYKKRITTRLAELKEKLDKGDYTKTVRPKLELDTEASKMRADYERERKKFESELEKIRLQQRNWFDKLTSKIAAVNRAGALSHISVLEHLSGAAVENIVTRPIGTALAQLFRFSKTLDSIRKKAVYEGTVSIGSELKGITGTLKSVKPLWDKLKTGESNIDVLNGLKSYPHSFLDVVSNVHGAIKEPVRQGIYARSLELRLKAAEEMGLDPARDAVLRTTLEREAYGDANMDIFTGDNFLTKTLHNAVVEMLRRNKTDPGLATFTADVLDILFPVVNVPVNIAIRKFRLATGLLESGTRLGIAAARGELSDNAAKLSPRDAELITKTFKYGAFGLALGVYAWNNADKFGGIYTIGKQVERDKKTGLNPGDVKLPNGSILSHHLLHGPVGGYMNSIADARRLYDSEVRGNPKNKWSALSDSAFFALYSQANTIPQLTTIGRITSPFKSGAQTVAQIIKNMVVPGIVQDYAEHRDKDSKGDPIKRSPKTGLEEFKTGIPGLREAVPATKKH